MDAYLEEELYDLLTYCAQNPDASEFDSKKQRVEEIGKELYTDGGSDAMENMFYSIEFRVKEEIGKDAKPYRLWWNNINVKCERCSHNVQMWNKCFYSCSNCALMVKREEN